MSPRPFSRSLPLLVGLLASALVVAAPRPALALGSDPGGSLRVSELTLEGCEAFGRGRLLKLMETRPPKLRFWKGPYHADVFEKDLARLVDFYHRRGYLQAEVEDKETRMDKDGRSIRLKAWIYEGPLSRVGRLRWEGVTALDAGDLRRCLRLKTGGPLDDDLLKATLREVVKRYADEGYLEAQVRPILTWDKDHLSADVLLNVKEGALSRLGGFDIRGLGRSRDWVVWREFRTRRGEPLRRDRITVAQQRLYLTGIFQTLYVRPLPGSPENPDLRTLLVEVQENKTKEFNLTGGWGSIDHFRGQAEISDIDLLGRARHGSVIASASRLAQRLEGNYGSPWTAGFPWFNNVNLFVERQDQPGYDLNRVGGILTVGKNFTAVSKFQVSYRHENAYLAHVEVDPAPDTNKDFVRSFTLSLVLDRRDSFTDPKEGYYLASSAEMSGAFLHGTNTFLRTIHQFKLFHPLTPTTVFGTALEAGWVGNYKSSQALALSELFYAGGGSSLRGFGYRLAGPLDSQGLPLGGQFKLVLNAVELRQKVWKSIHVSGFWDCGNVFKNIDLFDLENLRHTLGWGIRLTTPMGVLRVDQGFILKRHPGERPQRLYVNIGHAF